MLPARAFGFRRALAAAPVIANGQNWSATVPLALGGASASFTVDTNGTTSGSGDVVVNSNWRTPTLAGVGTGFWVEAVRVSGAIPTGTLNTRLQLSSARSWSIERLSQGITETQLQLRFYDAASGGNLLGTNTLTMSVTVDTGS